MSKSYKIKKYIRYIEIKTTCPNMDTTEKIANSLVANKLVSCVNIQKFEKSIYLWNWKIEKKEEYLLTMKTRWRFFKKIEKIIKELHTYTTPEIIAIPIIKWNEEYLRWIDQSLWLNAIEFEK